jgi:two-component system nitrate/nitrite response regulator NarL
VTNVALFSVQPILVAGLRSVLAKEGDLFLSAVCSTVPELIADVTAERPGVMLIEVTPEIGLDVLHQVKTFAAGVPIVLWVDTVAVEFVSQVIGIGVRGILRKTLPPADVVECLRKVGGGELWIEKPLCDRLLCTKRVALTPRERQLLALLAQGLKNKEIAYTLQITEGTVKVYLSRLFQKVGANDRFDLALFALKNFAATPQGLGSQFQALRPGHMERIPPHVEFLPNFVSFDR